MKEGPKNRLREQDIHRIVDVFTREDASDPCYARMVSFDEIEKNDFNLNLPRYIDSARTEDVQDIEAHLNGGIPAADIEALGHYWAVCPRLQGVLFEPLRPGYASLAVEAAAVKATVHAHPEFAAFIACMDAHFAQWRAPARQQLVALQTGFHPKALIEQVAEGLLAHYQGLPLIDAYSVYQHLMDYWAASMQDDAYAIAADGWVARTRRVFETKKGKKGEPDKQLDKGWNCDLLPKPYIVARYFVAEQAVIDWLGVDLEAVLALITELEEEHNGEDDVFSGFDKINAASVKERLRDLGGALDDEEGRVLPEWQRLTAQATKLKKKLGEAEATLDDAAYAQYPQLTEAEVQGLVVDDKWLAALDVAVHGEMDRMSRALTHRVKELAERYGTPLPQLVERADELEAKVQRHLATIGFGWT